MSLHFTSQKGSISVSLWKFLPFSKEPPSAKSFLYAHVIGRNRGSAPGSRLKTTRVCELQLVYLIRWIVHNESLGARWLVVSVFASYLQGWGSMNGCARKWPPLVHPHVQYHTAERLILPPRWFYYEVEPRQEKKKTKSFSSILWNSLSLLLESGLTFNNPWATESVFCTPIRWNNKICWGISEFSVQY